MSDSYEIRTLSGSDPFLKPYKSMIYSDFKRSLRFGNDWFTLIDQARYFAVYDQVIDQLMRRRDAIVRLATLTDDPDVCLGWSLSEDEKLHYVFVKKDLRKQGIAKALLPKHFNQLTHLTRLGAFLWKTKMPELFFDPFLT